jgi:hypothetical protein
MVPINVTRAHKGISNLPITQRAQVVLQQIAQSAVMQQHALHARPVTARCLQHFALLVRPTVPRAHRTLRALYPEVLVNAIQVFVKLDTAKHPREPAHLVD